MHDGPLHIVQVLPELNSGGVERGTVEFSRYLIEHGHQSTVISHGGRLVDQLIQEGGEHVAFPVHKKSLLSLRFVKPLRKLILSLNPDVVHVRSRLPAWLIWLAIGRLPKNKRPALVSTFHGLYSINRYSEIMGCGDKVIAISQCVYDYISTHYPKVSSDKISIVHRGVDQSIFNTEYRPNNEWRQQFFNDFPQCKDKPLIIMPGRITSWKGHEDFIDVMARLKKRNVSCHGVIVGGAENTKHSYFDQIKNRVQSLGLSDMITFVGHRSDIHNIYTQAKVVCNLSNRPEPFGRTVIEALALGVPVVAYDSGGPAESLRACFPQGLAPYKDNERVADIIESCLREDSILIHLPKEFTLADQAEKTLALYQQAINA
ncbi:MAG: glycosyltransferase family 4 protein [Cellvibrionaceae bacterium]